MKMKILKIVLFIMALGLFYTIPANAQEDNVFKTKYSITKKTYFTTPLFEKVFPGTDFYLGLLNFGYNMVYYDIDGEPQNISTKMNTLIKKCQSTKYATIEEIIEAMVRLKFYGQDTSNYDIIVTKEFNKNPKIKEDTNTYNYKIVIKNSAFRVGEYYYFKFDGINFINSCSFNDGGLFDFSDRSFIDEKIDDVCVNINNSRSHGPEEDGYYHYYKIAGTIGAIEFVVTMLEETLLSGDKIDIEIKLHDSPNTVIEHQENIA